MNKIIEKYAQKLANQIINRLEIAIKNESYREFDMLLDFGLTLDRWCINKGIELQ